MTEIELVQALQRRIDFLNQGWLYPCQHPEQTERAIQTFLYDLPAKRSQSSAPDEHPCIVIRPTHGNTQDIATNIANIDLMLTVYNRDTNHQGRADAIAIMSRLRLDFFSNLILEQKFVFNKEFKWVFLDDQKFPYYTIAMETQWQINQPQNTQFEV